MAEAMPKDGVEFHSREDLELFLSLMQKGLKDYEALATLCYQRIYSQCPAWLPDSEARELTGHVAEHVIEEHRAMNSKYTKGFTWDKRQRPLEIERQAVAMRKKDLEDAGFVDGLPTTTNNVFRPCGPERPRLHPIAIPFRPFPAGPQPDPDPDYRPSANEFEPRFESCPMEVWGGKWLTQPSKMKIRLDLDKFPVPRRDAPDLADRPGMHPADIGGGGLPFASPKYRRD
jgi:hypothetical protein